MAYSPKRSAAAANAANDAQCALCNNGSLKIYEVGDGVPANVAASIPDEASHLLATLPMAATAFGASGAVTPGVATAGTITDDAAADKTGTAAFFRILASGGAAVFQGLCGTSGADLNLNTVAIVANATVSVTSLTITEALA